MAGLIGEFILDRCIQVQVICWFVKFGVGLGGGVFCKLTNSIK